EQKWTATRPGNRIEDESWGPASIEPLRRPMLVHTKEEKMKRAYRFVCLIVAAGILGVAFFPQRPLSAEDGDPESPWMEIEKAARASTLSELAKLVYNQAFNFEGLSATTADEVIDRMVRHEELYRRKSTGGVPEINVVRAVNAMLDRFDAPAYAYTDVYEVRRLQLGMV